MYVPYYRVAQIRGYGPVGPPARRSTAGPGGGVAAGPDRGYDPNHRVRHPPQVVWEWSDAEKCGQLALRHSAFIFRAVLKHVSSIVIWQPYVYYVLGLILG